MIKSFRDRKTEALFRGTSCDRRWRSFERIARRKLLMVQAASSLHDLKAPPSNKLEKLKRDRKGQHAIRINDQYRVCFRWAGGHAHDVEITDYH
ncbi:MAG TPA: type II toxin-antitoxin system RelE/ParE family toxin [Kiloniellaceae bacterium]